MRFASAAALSTTLAAAASSFVRGGQATSVGDHHRRGLAEGVWDLGNVRPEGIHILPEGALDLGEGTFALVTELLYGGVVAVNVDTGEITRVVNQTSFLTRAAVGIWFVPENG